MVLPLEGAGGVLGIQWYDIEHCFIFSVWLAQRQEVGPTRLGEARWTCHFGRVEPISPSFLLYLTFWSMEML